MINTLIFDLSEVYLTGFIGLENLLKEALNKDPLIILEKLRELRPEFKEFMKGNLKEEEFWKELIKRGNWDIEVDYLKNTVRESFKEIKGTRKIIESLKEKGYKLGLLSDHSKEWIEYCNNKFDYHKLFHSIQYSFEIGHCKPDKESFESILKKLNEAPENCLFVDDKEKNTLGARRIGINAIQFKKPEQLKEELKNYSIYV